MKYYNNNVYYTKRALKLAKRVNNEIGIKYLEELLKEGKTFPINFISEINNKYISDFNFFDVENSMKNKKI